MSLVCTLCLTNFHRPGICIYRSGVALRNCLFKHTKRRRPNASSYKQISISLVTGVCINSNSATTLLKKSSLSLSRDADRVCKEQGYEEGEFNLNLS